MITQLTLSQLASITQGQLQGHDCSFKSICIDSRALKKDDLFFVIKGKNFDGHEFAAQAQQLGAIAIVCEYPVSSNLPQVIVKDTRLALGDVARFIRETYPVPTVAITGSNGKTTAKSMLASILSLKSSILATEGTMNNDIGLPLTLFRQKAEDNYAVLELGTNHFGEIAYLSEIAKPDIAAITLIGPAHLEALGDLQGVSRAKGEIFQGLKRGGIGIVNADQPEYLNYFRSLIESQGKLMTFGVSKTADVRAENIRIDEDSKPVFDLIIGSQRKTVHLQVLGQFNVNNALTAAAAAHALGLSMDIIVKGLEETQAVNKRLNIRQGLNGSTLIDDSYNAIPNAVLAAIDILANQSGEKIFAFGGMAELGAHPEKYYRDIGEYARKKGVNKIIICDPLGHVTASAFGEGGITIEHRGQFIETLKELLKPDVTMLLKARRGFKMEEVVESLVSA